MQENCLERRNLYILPTRHGIIFTLILFAMLLIAVNYNNSLAYLMTFTLAATVMLSMLFTHRNLQGLCLSYGECDPVHAGDILTFKLIIVNKTRRDRYDIGIDIHGDKSARHDFTAEEEWVMSCRTRAVNRGWQSLPEVQVNTRYPFGLLFSWSKKSNMIKKALIYPKPATWVDFPVSSIENKQTANINKISHDDFSGLRRFREGDPPQHIDWKSYARGKGLYSKEFVSGEIPELFFNWEDSDGDKEQRISQLTRWILEAAMEGMSFGMAVPGFSVSAGSSEKHMHTCLKHLALL